MAAQGALGEVEVTNVEEVAEGRVRGLADARSGDVSRALAAAADRTNVGGMSFLLNIEMQKANMNLGYLVTEADSMWSAAVRRGVTVATSTDTVSSLSPRSNTQQAEVDAQNMTSLSAP